MAAVRRDLTVQPELTAHPAVPEVQVVLGEQAAPVGLVEGEAGAAKSLSLRPRTSHSWPASWTHVPRAALVVRGGRVGPVGWAEKVVRCNKRVRGDVWPALLVRPGLMAKRAKVVPTDRQGRQLFRSPSRVSSYSAFAFRWACSGCWIGIAEAQ